jgi:cell division protein FtsW
MEKNKKHIDYSLFLAFFVLIIFGLLVLSSSTIAIASQRFSDPYFFLKRQILHGLLPGLVLFFIFINVEYNFWKKYSLIFYFLAIFSLILVFIPGIGSDHNTFAKSWLNIFGFSFQPAEFIKLIFIIYISAYLSELKDDIKDKKNLLTTLVIGSIPIFLIILQPDLGTALIYSAIFFALLFFSKTNLLHLLLLVLAGLFFVFILINSSDRATNRINTFLHPELDPKGVGYQIDQSFLAIGSGGFWGLGIGNSRQKFQYLPEVQSDSIFAIMAEEFGFLIVFLFLILLLFIFLKSFKIAKKSNDEFSKLVILGIISWWFIQTMMNIGAIIGILPLTGVPLPFVSHGGTALLVNLLALSVILNISKSAK